MVLIEKVKIPVLSGDAQRRLYIYLPDTYASEPQRCYPVIYMFDGHNVFFDQHATFGKSWGMEQNMDNAHKQWIIVAVECNTEGNCRLEEYAPFDFSVQGFGSFTGKGNLYMDWLTGTLKPWIDANYRTIPDNGHTAICGSSMGGLMSLYAVSVYNHVFRQAACLSPSLWIAPEKVKKMLNNVQFDAVTSVYMDYGSEEMTNHAGSEQALSATVQLLQEKGVDTHFRIVPGGTHCEASWEKQFPYYMAVLDRAVGA